MVANTLPFSSVHSNVVDRESPSGSVAFAIHSTVSPTTGVSLEKVIESMVGSWFPRVMEPEALPLPPCGSTAEPEQVMTSSGLAMDSVRVRSWFDPMVAPVVSLVHR